MTVAAGVPVDDPASIGDTASILHADLDAFYASIEQRDDPLLRAKPVLVGGGVVLAASYEARAFGVRTPMPVGIAMRLCPKAVVVAPRMDAYLEASRQVFAVFASTTPLVEGLSIDEAFLDVGGLRRLAGSPAEVAARLRAEVHTQVGLPITVGGARTKFLAKVASGVAKPDGLLIVEPADELSFLHPLAVERLWGVGRVTAAKLRSRGLATVGAVAALPVEALVAMVGDAAGRHLHALAHNRDPRPVTAHRERRSVGSQQALPQGPKTRRDIDAVVLMLADRVAGRLRAGYRTGRTITVRLRFDDYSNATRSATVAPATATTDTIVGVARSLMAAAAELIEARGLTLVGLAVSNLTEGSTTSDSCGHGVSRQLMLGEVSAKDGGPGTGTGNEERRMALDEAMDDVSVRFGPQSIKRAVHLKRPITAR